MMNPPDRIWRIRSGGFIIHIKRAMSADAGMTSGIKKS